MGRKTHIALLTTIQTGSLSDSIELKASYALIYET